MAERPSLRATRLRSLRELRRGLRSAEARSAKAEAKQSRGSARCLLDCFVAPAGLLAMTGCNGEERIMPGELVQCSVADGVALVTLNNPPLNLVTLALTNDLNALVARLA